MEQRNRTIKIENLQTSNNPIDYFKVKSEYFYNGANVDELTITPNTEGYISSQLEEIVKSRDNDIPETIIINAGVGQGKSTFAINIISHYLEISVK